MASGLIFDIQRFAIHDGPGIRTAVFLKGCPLRCLWCHNPEGQSAQPEILFSPEKCISCRYCESVCEYGSHTFLDGEHWFDRTSCTGCGECTQECYSRALEWVGKEMQVGEVLEEVLKDLPFYQSSGGGLTVSGGEPMQQYQFTLALLQAARCAGLHTCLETSGYSTTERYLSVRPYVDLFYFDVKETNPMLHLQYTGVSNAGILENLATLDAAGAAIVLRCPLIPGLNDRSDHLDGIACLANQLRSVKSIHLLPYHNLGTSKSQRLGRTPQLQDTARPGKAEIEAWASALRAQTAIPVLVD